MQMYRTTKVGYYRFEPQIRVMYRRVFLVPNYTDGRYRKNPKEHAPQPFFTKMIGPWVGEAGLLADGHVTTSWPKFWKEQGENILKRYSVDVYDDLFWEYNKMPTFEEFMDRKEIGWDTLAYVPSNIIEAA